MSKSFRTRKRGTPKQIGKKFPVMEKKKLPTKISLKGGKLSKKFVVKKYVQSRGKPPTVVDNIFFSTEEEALNFYRRMKRTANWPWTFYAYPEEVGHSVIPEPSQDREKQIRESYEKFKKEHGIKSGGKIKQLTTVAKRGTVIRHKTVGTIAEITGSDKQGFGIKILREGDGTIPPKGRDIAVGLFYRDVDNWEIIE